VGIFVHVIETLKYCFRNGELAEFRIRIRDPIMWGVLINMLRMIFSCVVSSYNNNQTLPCDQNTPGEQPDGVCLLVALLECLGTLFMTYSVLESINHRIASNISSFP
jgi:hypothetical protein